jgi:hypothetical protein
MLLFAAAADGADNPTKAGGTMVVDESKASGTLGGRAVRFPRQAVKDGVTAAVGLLESCHDSGKGYSKEDWQKAQAGDHVLLVLAKPRTVTVLGRKVEVAQLLVTFPLSAGVIWVRSGEEVLRFAKYEFPKERPLTTWLRQAKPSR